MSTVVGSLSVLLSVVPKMDGAFAQLGKLQNMARALVGVGALRGVVRYAEEIAGQATHLNSFAQSLGLTVEAAQEWDAVAKASGSNWREFARGVSMAEGNLRKLADGKASKSLASTFATLGTDQAGATAALKDSASMDAWLKGIADRYQKIASKPRANAALRGVFGAIAARSFAGDFGGGSKRIDELQAKRRAMGLLSQTDVNNLRDLSNESKNVTGSFSAIASIVLAKLAPGLIDLARRAQDWIAANKDVISGSLETAFNGVAFALSLIGDAIDLVVKIGRGLSDWIDAVKDGSPLAVAGLAALGTVLAAVVVPAIVALGVAGAETLAIWTAGLIAVMLPLLPIVLVVAAVAAGIALIVRHWDKVGGLVKGIAKWLVPVVGLVLLIKEHWDGIVSAIGRAWSAVKNFGADVGTFFEDVASTITGAFKKAFDYLADLPVIKQVLAAIEWARSVGGDATGATVGDTRGIGGKAFDFAFVGPMSVAVNALPNPAAAPSANSTVISQSIVINGVTGADRIPSTIGRAGDEMSRRVAASALGMGLGDSR